MSAEDIWQNLTTTLISRLTSTVFNTWFDDAVPVSFRNDHFVLRTSSAFKKDMITRRYSEQLSDDLSIMFSRSVTVEIISNGEEILTFGNGDASGGSNENKMLFGTEFSFSSFVIGNSNKFAHAAARAVADSPAEAYNPLLIYGDSGLGKTHLLYAIANVIATEYPKFRIIYRKGDEFTNELIRSIQYNKTSEFRDKYRMADILLMDDIQFIAGKERTQEEFFHTFNTLYEAKRQIVLTADRPPRDMALLEDRLKTRFEWGLTADIQPPDIETRIAIIKNKAQHLGINLEYPIVEQIAQGVTSNIRQLEGAVKKLLAYRDLMSAKVDHALAERAINDVYRESPGLNPTPALIIEEVCNYFSLDAKDICGQKRDRDITHARHIAMYLIRQLTKLSLMDIGREFNNRNHTTTKYSTEKIENDIKKDAELAGTVKNITDNIRNR